MFNWEEGAENKLKMIDLSPTKQKSPTIAIVTLIINKQTKHPVKIQSLSDWITKRKTQLNVAYMKYTSNVNTNRLKV